MSLNNLALLLDKLGDRAAARHLYERALAILVKTLGTEHPETNLVRGNLSHVLLLIGTPTEARAMGETALAALDKFLGRDHPWTKNSARVTADALGPAEGAKALREKYGLTAPEEPKSP
jgi:Tetratricopeptide repeat